MNRKQKQTAVDNLKEAFSAATIVVVGQNGGITAGQASELRKNIRTVSGTTVVSKNTLTKLAAQGSDYENLSSLLKGPTVLMYSDNDPVAIAKTVVSFAKDNATLEIKGGAMGSKFLDLNTLKALAELPSLDQLRAKIIGVIQAPASKLARVIQTPAQQLAQVCKAYSEK